MNTVYLLSQHVQDATVLQDILRAHFPGVKLVHSKPGETVAQKGEEAAALLEIEKKYNPPGYYVCLKNKGSEYSHAEYLREDLFAEEKINRERRMLRLAVFQVMKRFFADYPDNAELGPSPWGVLTGVRPTKIVHKLFQQGYLEATIINYLRHDYGISEKKAQLVLKTAAYQLPYLLQKKEDLRKISLYVGIPFCPTRCYYCSFPSYSLQKWGRLLAEYLAALRQEMLAAAELLMREGLTVETVYVGGGTPTVLSADQLDSLLGMIENSFPLEANCEITVEGGRPDTLDYDKLVTLRKRGANRLSINPQTMCEATLRAVGRRHTVADVVESYKLARDVGPPIINMDLIIGLPCENKSVLANTLKEVLALYPENITLHAVAIKRAALYRRENLRLPGYAKGQAMMELAQETMEQAGYIPYYLYRQKEILAHGENVGYTLKGFACLYNILMMEERQTIIGCGVGAGSKIVNVHDWSVDNFYNPRDLLVYMNRLAEIKTKKVDKLQAFVYNNF